MPSIDASPSVVIERREDYSDGLVSISCTPSDPDAVIYWQTSNGGSLAEAFPGFEFLPMGLDHVVRLTEVPERIEVLYCGLYNRGTDSLLNANKFTVVAVSCKYLDWERGMSE